MVLFSTKVYVYLVACLFVFFLSFWLKNCFSLVVYCILTSPILDNRVSKHLQERHQKWTPQEKNSVQLNNDDLCYCFSTPGTFLLNRQPGKKFKEQKMSILNDWIELQALVSRRAVWWEFVLASHQIPVTDRGQKWFILNHVNSETNVFYISSEFFPRINVFWSSFANEANEKSIRHFIGFLK